MRKADMLVGADVYYNDSDDWRGSWSTPTRATIVDVTPRRITRTRCGAVYLVTHSPDPAGNAILVDLHEATGTRRTAVRTRHLRGLWAETLALVGLTEERLAARREGIRRIVAKPGEVSTDDVLGVAANSGMPDDAFIALAQAAEGRPIGDHL